MREGPRAQRRTASDADPPRPRRRARADVDRAVLVALAAVAGWA